MPRSGSYQHTFETSGDYTVGLTVTNNCGQGGESTMVTVQQPDTQLPDLSTSIKTVNLRLSKLFEIGDFGIDVFGEAFNLFDDNSFSVGGSQAEVGDSEFGIADNQIGDQRQYQVGFRLTFN